MTFFSFHAKCRIYRCGAWRAWQYRGTSDCDPVQGAGRTAALGSCDRAGGTGEAGVGECQSCHGETEKKLEALQKETKTAKTVALTVQEIETMGKKATFGNNITLTPDECDTLKRYAVNGIIANADNKRLKEKLASAEKTVSIWKQRYEAVNEKYMELKQKAQPFLDALEIASERVRAFINSILIRGKGNAGTQTPCPEAWTGYGTLMEESPIEEIL